MLNLIAFILMLLASFFALATGIQAGKIDPNEPSEKKSRKDNAAVSSGAIIWLVLFIIANVLFIWS